MKTFFYCLRMVEVQEGYMMFELTPIRSPVTLMRAVATRSLSLYGNDGWLATVPASSLLCNHNPSSSSFPITQKCQPPNCFLYLTKYPSCSILSVSSSTMQPLTRDPKMIGLWKVGRTLGKGFSGEPDHIVFGKFN